MDEDKKVLEQLMLDIDILNKLNKWTSDVNFFELSGMSNQEIKHSNTLAWFLDSNENHYLGEQFIKRFLQKVITENRETNSDINIFDVSIMEYSSFIIKREWKNIDILIYSNDLKMVIIIENKVYATESKGQLNKYYKTINEEFKDYKKLFIFLTREGVEPKNTSDLRYWYLADYRMIIESLEDTLLLKPNLTTKTKIIINDYINIIRRNFGMDKELTETAQKIYSKHKRAFDLIFEVTSNSVTQFSSYIKSWLEENKEKYEINFDSKFSSNAYIRFTTPFIDEMFPFDEEKDDSWGFGHSFMYEIVVSKNSIHVGGVLSHFKRENSDLFSSYKARKAKKWKVIMQRKQLLNEEDIADGLNEDTIETLKSALQKTMKDYIPKFEKAIKELAKNN